MKKVKLKNLDFGIIGIYKLDFPNGKCYIGQSIDIRSRVREHNQRAKKINSARNIQNCEHAIRKYGEISEFYILEICEIVELDDKEKYWINFYHSTERNKGYNLLDHGDVSGRRGYDNYHSISRDKCVEITKFIIANPHIPLRKIGQYFQVSDTVMVRINNGRGYVALPEYHYPLRDTKDKFWIKKEKIEDYFCSKQDYEAFLDDLKNNQWLDMEKGLPKKYSLPRTLVKDINYGRKFKNPKIKYPIRKKGRPNKLTKKQVKEVLELLRSTKIPMSEIAKKYGVGRNFVSKINQGERCLLEDYNYPARITH